MHIDYFKDLDLNSMRTEFVIGHNRWVFRLAPLCHPNHCDPTQLDFYSSVCTCRFAECSLLCQCFQNVGKTHGRSMYKACC